jgi:hypothetical protein
MYSWKHGSIPMLPDTLIILLLEARNSCAKGIDFAHREELCEKCL